MFALQYMNTHEHKYTPTIDIHTDLQGLVFLIRIQIVQKTSEDVCHCGRNSKETS